MRHVNPDTSEISAPKILEDLIQRAEQSGASDIHLQMAGKAAQVSFRLDGVMTPSWELGEPVAERVFGRIKFLARLMTIPRLRRTLRWRLPAVKEAAVSQIASMLSLLLKGGENLADALGLVRHMEADTPAGHEIARWQRQLASGQGKFADLAAGGKVFPPLFYWLVAGGGEDLAEGFRRAADVYHARAAFRTEMLLYVALPVAVLGLGILVLGEFYPFLKIFISWMTLIDNVDGPIGN